MGPILIRHLYPGIFILNQGPDLLRPAHRCYRRFWWSCPLFNWRIHRTQCFAINTSTDHKLGVWPYFHTVVNKKFEQDNGGRCREKSLHMEFCWMSDFSNTLRICCLNYIWNKTEVNLITDHILMESFKSIVSSMNDYELFTIFKHVAKYPIS